MLRMVTYINIYIFTHVQHALVAYALFSVEESGFVVHVNALVDTSTDETLESTRPTSPDLEKKTQ